MVSAPHSAFPSSGSVTVRKTATTERTRLIVVTLHVPLWSSPVPVAAVFLVNSSAMVKMTAVTAVMNRTALLPPAAQAKSLVGTIRVFLEAGYVTMMWTAKISRMSPQSAAATTRRRRPNVRPARCSAALANAFTGSGAATETQIARMAATRKTALPVTADLTNSSVMTAAVSMAADSATDSEIVWMEQMKSTAKT